MINPAQNALIIGYGSIGKRHVKNLQALSVNDISVYDPYFTGIDHTVKFLQSLPVAESFDLCFICSPNDKHLESLEESYGCSKSFFIEKPVSIHQTEYKKFQALVSSKAKPIMVGCNYRFDGGLLELKKMLDEEALGQVLFFKSEFGHYLPSWRPNQDYRKNYAAKKETGGGVLLDRIHEFDYLKWLFGSMTCESALALKLSSLEIQTEDISMIHFKTKNGFVGSLHLDYLQPNYLCQLKVVGTLGALEWGFKPSYLKHTDSFGKVRFIQETSETDVNSMYVNQLKYFLNAIRIGDVPFNGLNEAFDTLKLVDQVKEKASA